MIRLVGTGQGAVQRELERLHKAGIATRIRRGNLVYYQANPACPVFSELSGLMVKTTGEADALAAALRPLAESIKVAFIHGPYAAGQTMPGTAVDLFAVGMAGVEQLASRLRPVELRLGRRVNVSVFGQSEFRTKAARADQFIYSVLKGRKIFLLGDEAALEQLT
ncbi:MAG: winged helix-turn-helix domain-containing protein [Candidatus Edwardsbacteria bacterium]|nr:winged helix-turn-helix domain-containing protein [Candidatus Edwardsbacteria bacterium]